MTGRPDADSADDLPRDLAEMVEELSAPAPWPPGLPPPPEPGSDYDRRYLAWCEAMDAAKAAVPSVPIPAEEDSRRAAFLDAVRNAPPPVRETVAARLGNHASARLAGFAERMATLAVRLGERVQLESAVLALALAYQAGLDRRDVLIAYPLPYHAARRLGLDPDALYAATAAVAPALGAEALRAFARRDERDKSLTAFGWAEGADADGFRFVRLPAPSHHSRRRAE